MMRIATTTMIWAALTVASVTVQAPAVAQTAPATQAPHYSVSTTLVGKLLDDPAAAAVLKRMIPTTFANEMFQSMGREATLQAIQQYAPEELSDANLAKIQAEFDKMPAKG